MAWSRQTGSISISTINHHPHWELDPGVTPEHPAEFIKYNVSCLIYYDPNVPPENNPKSITLWGKVDFREDRTDNFEVPDGDARAVEFFWEDLSGGQVFRRMAWYDREQKEYGKPWGWLGMFWLFDSYNNAVYERTAAAIALTKFDPTPPPLWTARRPK